MTDYATSKWMNELQIMNAQATHGAKTVHIRLFNTYGVRRKYHDYFSMTTSI
jgi:dTDP-glucose 4,6-dehydratase